MNYENIISNSEQVVEYYDKLVTYEPKLVSNFVPADAAEQKEAFLSGIIENPDHTYARLAGIDFIAQETGITEAGRGILQSPDLNPKFRPSYESFIESYQQRTHMMKLVRDFKQAPADERGAIGEECMRLNIDLYGAPDEMTYYSLLQEKVVAIDGKELVGRAVEIRTELAELLPPIDTTRMIERFVPSDETIQWMHGVANTLYGGMLTHVPDDKENFSPTELQAIFAGILSDEFGGEADGWRVDIEPAKSINVKPGEKRIVIPETRGNVPREQVRSLIVHEIGVHVLRAIMGETTDFHLLRQGMVGYLDSEEGLGKVMEQALAGTFKEAGIDHYITAGAAYFDHKDFRELFELKWRLSTLGKVNSGTELTNEQIEQSKNTAYNETMRCLRGTDELPWFKDLSYYNGSVGMWKHLESIRGDEIQFMFVLMGKADPARIDHQRAQYETRTV
jgi:uncharacterized protein DUF1704